MFQYIRCALEKKGALCFWIVGAHISHEIMLVKARLAAVIAEIVTSKGLKQRQAAELLGMTQAKLLNLLNERLRGISEARMMDCLARLGRDVRIVIGQERPRRKRSARIEVLQEA